MVKRFVAFCRTNKTLLAVLALAVLLRVFYLMQYSQSSAWEQLTVDNWYHHHWAQSLADGNLIGDTTYFRAPFYIYCLGILYALFGATLWTARLFGVMVGLTSVVMTYLLGRRMVSRGPALVAAALHAVYPIIIYFESELLLDPLFTLLVQIAVHRFLIWLETRQSTDILLTGILFGLAAITRPTILIAVPIVILWLGINRVKSDPGRVKALGSIGLFLGAVSICVMPVLVRNVVVAGDPVLISAQGGINLYLGNNEAADGLSAVMPEPLGNNWQMRQITYLAETARGQSLNPGQVSDYWRDQALDWIAKNPMSAVGLFLKKLAFQFADREISNNRPLGPHLASIDVLTYIPVSFGMLIPLAVLGGICSWTRSRESRFVLILMGGYLLIVSLFFFNSRFRLPLLPYYFIFATGGAGWIIDLARRRSRQLITLIVGAIALGWLSFHPPLNYPNHWSSQSLTSRGLYHYHRGEMTESLDYFRDALRLDPHFPEVHLNLGVAHFRLGQTDSAAAYFQREIENHPERPKAYYNLASLNLVNGHWREAISLVDQALELAPYDVTAQTIRLRALGADSVNAVYSLAAAVEAAAAATGDDRFTLNEGAGLLMNIGNLEAALVYLKRAETARPPPIETDDLAFSPNFKHSRHNYDKARARTSYLLGYCHAQSGLADLAIEYTRIAITFDSTLVEAYVNLYVGYRSLGRLMVADSVLTEASVRFPGHDLIKDLLNQ